MKSLREQWLEERDEILRLLQYGKAKLAEAREAERRAKTEYEKGLADIRLRQIDAANAAIEAMWASVETYSAWLREQGG